MFLIIFFDGFVDSWANGIVVVKVEEDKQRHDNMPFRHEKRPSEERWCSMITKEAWKGVVSLNEDRTNSPRNSGVLLIEDWVC